MRRSTVIVLLLFATLWQSVALARVGSTVNVLIDFEHAALHLQGEGHHHDEDGSYDLDDSNESVQHAVTDQLSASLALAASPLHELPPLASAAPGGLLAMVVANPMLDGLLRPPRPHA